MKRIVFLTCIGSLALALTAFGAPKGKGGHGSAKGQAARAVRMSYREAAVIAASMRTAPHRSAAQSHQAMATQFAGSVQFVRSYTQFAEAAT